MNNQEQVIHKEQETQESDVLRPKGERSHFARLPGVIATVVAVGMGAGVSTEAKAGGEDVAKVVGVVAGVILAGKAIETIRDGNLEEIHDRVGNTEIFIDVEAQKTMKKIGLVYNKSKKTVENPSRWQTIHFSNPDRNDLAVQVSSLTPQQLRYTYIYLDKDGKKFGQNVLVSKDGLGNVRVGKYRPIPVVD